MSVLVHASSINMRACAKMLHTMIRKPLCIIIGAPFGSCCSLTIHNYSHLTEAMEDVKSHKCFLFQWVPFGVCQ